MSVGFPSSYPAKAASASPPVDLQTLQETFAAVLRSYGTAKGGGQTDAAQTDSLLEILQVSQENGSADARQQTRQELQQRLDRNDHSQIDRKLQNQSDRRSSEMHSEYQQYRDRHDVIQNEYQETARRNELSSTGIPAAGTAHAATGQAPTEGAVPSLTPPNVAVPNVLRTGKLGVPASGNPSPHAGTSAASVHSLENDRTQSMPVEPMPMTTPFFVGMPQASTSPGVPAQAFTIFTAWKSFGQSQDKPDKKKGEDDNDESAEEMPVKKAQPFALFEAIQAGRMFPLHGGQSKRAHVSSESQQAAKLVRERPKEIEPNRLPHVKTLDEMLSTPTNDRAASKPEDVPQQEQTQYFHRIAAACEAASQYAPIRMKIHLDQLGTLTLRFFYRSEKLMLHFETPSHQSARFLHEQLEGLKTLLTKRNVQLASVEVRLIGTGGKEREA